MTITAPYFWPRQTAWFGAHLVLLVTFGLGVVLSLINHHAAECDPWHDHIVIGGDAREQAQALASHHHACGWAQTPGPITEHTFPPYADERRVTNVPRVISFSSRTGASLFTVTTQVLLAPDSTALQLMLLRGERPFLPTFLLSEIDLPVPDPPPRGAD